MKALGSGQHTKPWSRHPCATRSSATRSRMISTIAVPKMTVVPARLPRIGWPVSQMGYATSPATTVGPVSASAIQNQLSSCTRALAQDVAVLGRLLHESLHGLTPAPLCLLAPRGSNQATLPSSWQGENH